MLQQRNLIFIRFSSLLTFFFLTEEKGLKIMFIFLQVKIIQKKTQHN